MKPQKPLKPKPKPAKAKAKSERHFQWGAGLHSPPTLHKNSDPNACDTPVLERARGQRKGMPARESTRVNEASKLLRARYARSPKSCKILHGTSHRCPRREMEVVGADAGQLHTCALNCMCLGVGTPSQEMKTKPNQSEPNRTHASTGVASLLSCLLPHKSQPQKSIKPRCHLHRQQAGVEAERGKKGDRVYGVLSLSLF